MLILLNPILGLTYNTTAVEITLSTLKLPAHKLFQHPGPGGDNSVIRWISPQTGIYSIDSSFTGIDFVYPTTTDVAVLRNSSEQLFAGDISSYNIPLPYFQIIYVTQGDTIDFSVGFGTNANYFGDATMTNAVITKRNNFKAKLDVSSIALYYGQTGNLTARLRKATSLESVQNAPITFKVDGVIVGTGTTDNTGLAAYPYTADESLAVGVHTLTAEFAGAVLVTKSAKLTIRQTASSLSVSSAAGAPGASVNFKAKLKRKTDSQPLAGRDVSFSVDGVAVGTAVTDGTGVATLPYAIGESAIGTYTLVASYAGTIQYSASSSTGKLTVKQANTSLKQSSVKGKAGSIVTLTATLKRNTDNKLLANETVDFFVDGVSVGTGTTDVNGVATLSYTVTQAVGIYALKVAFGGDVNYLASSYAKASLTVK
ncbi:MAG: Ig-like domain-containing protein [Armatimonadetes bacterium]|nr:Ig-like domain-containing protein [Armatimonadota bacterium]